jgi:glycosyltransferase involved in cell wall biosynthesis
VTVLDSFPDQIMLERADTGKPTFILGERFVKKGFFRLRMLNPRFARGIRRLRAIANRPNVHYLAIGKYAASDAKLMGAFGDRLWTWAYFTEVASQSPEPRSKHRVRILWVGRMLRWKRVDVILRAVARVGHDPNFERLDIVGAGPEKASLLKLAKKLGLGDKCLFHEPVPAARVRELMREADVYVLSSNRCEGWGAVAGEAMSEGAVLAASDEAGAARVLIDQGRTGFLFEDGNAAALAEVLQTILAEATLRETVRQAAWREMQRLWHPRVGAERLIALCHGILGLKPMPAYQQGPCSSCLLK